MKKSNRSICICVNHAQGHHHYLWCPWAFDFGESLNEQEKIPAARENA
jgi:hypothetical protein